MDELFKFEDLNIQSKQLLRQFANKCGRLNYYYYDYVFCNTSFHCAIESFKNASSAFRFYLSIVCICFVQYCHIIIVCKEVLIDREINLFKTNSIVKCPNHRQDLLRQSRRPCPGRR